MCDMLVCNCTVLTLSPFRHHTLLGHYSVHVSCSVGTGKHSGHIRPGNQQRPLILNHPTKHNTIVLSGVYLCCSVGRNIGLCKLPSFRLVYIHADCDSNVFMFMINHFMKFLYLDSIHAKHARPWAFIVQMLMTESKTSVICISTCPELPPWLFVPHWTDSAGRTPDLRGSPSGIDRRLSVLVTHNGQGLLLCWCLQDELTCSR